MRSYRWKVVKADSHIMRLTEEKSWLMMLEIEAFDFSAMAVIGAAKTGASQMS